MWVYRLCGGYIFFFPFGSPMYIPDSQRWLIPNHLNWVRTICLKGTVHLAFLVAQSTYSWDNIMKQKIQLILSCLFVTFRIYWTAEYWWVGFTEPFEQIGWIQFRSFGVLVSPPLVHPTMAKWVVISLDGHIFSGKGGPCSQKAFIVARDGLFHWSL